MASEIRKTNVTVNVVLGEKPMALAALRALEIGQTLQLTKGPDDPLDLQCGGVTLGQAQIGQRAGRVAVRLVTDIVNARHQGARQ